MKVCEVCGADIDGTKDGENRCSRHEDSQRVSKAKRQRKVRDQVMRDLGLVKVRGALGGTYWE